MELTVNICNVFITVLGAHKHHIKLIIIISAIIQGLRGKNIPESVGSTDSH